MIKGTSGHREMAWAVAVMGDSFEAKGKDIFFQLTGQYKF
jgi:hypothetical protein